MDISGNTILITGGGSGIGRALAESLRNENNQIIIAGRRQSALDEVTAANPGMKSIALDIEDPGSIRSAAAQLERDVPSLNVVIHNAGIMRIEDLQSPQPDLADAQSMIATNLLGPMRLTAALLPLLKRQAKSTIMTVSSGLAFVPLAITPSYCATKAAIHSWTQSLRWQLRNSNIEVVELIPPYVQTELMGPGQKQDPRAMPLEEFITAVMQILKDQPTATEINVERVKPLRFAAESGRFDEVFRGMNEAAH